MAKNVYGVFENTIDADNAIDSLLNSGVSRDQISVISRDTIEINNSVEKTTAGENVSKSATSGAITGGALGSLAGLLVGIGAIALPPIGGIFIAGPLAAALGISTAGASTIAGGGIGALGGWFGWCACGSWTTRKRCTVL